VFDVYREALADFPQMQWMPEPPGYHSTRWLTCFTLEPERALTMRSLIMKFLERHAIEARPVWKPMHLQPLFDGAPYFAHEDVCGCFGRLFESGICLPSGSNLTPEQQDRVMEHLRRALAMAEDRSALRKESCRCCWWTWLLVAAGVVGRILAALQPRHPAGV
jgi:dTDP-4-amino-4,6-dideoxygalactose transaminase